jgi:flagellin
MRIQTNLAALSAQRNLGVTNSALQVSTTRLSSGFRINRAADDAAGLSIANQMRGDVRSLQTASRNAAQAGSMLQIADGATATVSSILDRMKELATQAASDNSSADARGKLQDEFFALQGEIDRIVQSSQFQGKTLLDGSFGLALDAATTLDAHVDTTAGLQDLVSNINISGAQPGATYTMTIGVADGDGWIVGLGAAFADGTTSSQEIRVGTGGGDVSQVFNFDKLGVSFTYTGTVAAATFTGDVVATAATAGGGTFRIGLGTGGDSTINLALSSLATADLGIDSGTVNLTTMADAEAAINALDGAYSTTNSVIGQIGAAANRLEFASTNLSSIIQNTMAAESSIRDADMAYEMMQFSKQNILAQAGTAMLAQANSLSQSVLQLLR